MEIGCEVLWAANHIGFGSRTREVCYNFLMDLHTAMINAILSITITDINLRDF